MITCVAVRTCQQRLARKVDTHTSFLQLNKLIHTQILPYATGDDEDRVRDLTQRSSVQMIFYHQRMGIRKFFSKR